MLQMMSIFTLDFSKIATPFNRQLSSNEKKIFAALIPVINDCHYRFCIDISFHYPKSVRMHPDFVLESMQGVMHAGTSPMKIYRASIKTDLSKIIETLNCMLYFARLLSGVNRLMNVFRFKKWSSYGSCSFSLWNVQIFLQVPESYCLI